MTIIGYVILVFAAIWVAVPLIVLLYRSRYDLTFRPQCHVSLTEAGEIKVDGEIVGLSAALTSCRKTLVADGRVIFHSYDRVCASDDATKLYAALNAEDMLYPERGREGNVFDKGRYLSALETTDKRPRIL